MAVMYVEIDRAGPAARAVAYNTQQCRESDEILEGGGKQPPFNVARSHLRRSSSVLEVGDIYQAQVRR